MSSTKLYLDFRGKAKDGKGNVVIILAHNYTTTSIGTGVRLAREEWDGAQVVNRVDSKGLNIYLQNIKLDIDKRMMIFFLNNNVSKMTAAEIKAAINAGKKKIEKPKKYLLYDFFQEYKQAELSEGTKYIYDVTWSKIESYAGKDVKIDDIDYKWLIGFERFLAKTQGVNGRAIYLRSLRAICNYAKKMGVTDKYAFKDFSIKQEPTKKRSVSVEKLREFYYYPTKPHLAVYRDYFFLMFFLIGINVKDLLLAKPDAIQNGHLEYIREKTHKKYSIKVEPEALELLNKYKGKNYLVEAMDHVKDYKNYMNEINESLCLIGPMVEEEIASDELFGETQKTTRLAAIIPELTTYYARHCWATFAYQIGIPFDIISQALGHSFANRTTLIYVKFDQKRVDDANRRVIDYFFDKGGTE